MAYCIVHRFPGATKEQYEAAVAEVHPEGGKGLPEGQLVHITGPTDDGWIVIGVHDSRESWESFRDQTLMPGLQRLGDAGPPSPPDETAFETHRVQQG